MTGVKQLILTLALTMAYAAPRHTVLVHGHRGARAILPENTIPAFQYAIRAGADVLEMDIAVTLDEQLVISHDPRLNPEICIGPHPNAVIHELTLLELGRWDCGSLRNPRFPRQHPVPGTRVPTLDEVFEAAAESSVQFNIETKSFPDHPELTPPPDRFAALLLEVIRRHKMQSRVIVQSFDFRTLHAMQALDPKIRLSALWEGAPRDFVEIANEAGAGIISPEYNLVTPQQVERAHRARLQVVPWTANDPASWERLVQAQVDAIISDDPAALIAWLKSKGLRK